LAIVMKMNFGEMKDVTGRMFAVLASVGGCN
jgi:hypothetical protein